MFFTEKTTDLEIIRQEPERFAWGTIVKIHDIGGYTIVEHQTEDPDTGTSYHCYVDGRDTCHGAESMDHALAVCIAYRHDGPNSQAAWFFLRMIAAD